MAREWIPVSDSYFTWGLIASIEVQTTIGFFYKKDRGSPLTLGWLNFSNFKQFFNLLLYCQ